MDEAEWLACADPMKMLEFAWDKVSERKLQLFAAACCRRIWELMAGRSHQAVELAERHADEDDRQRDGLRAAADQILTSHEPPRSVYYEGQISCAIPSFEETVAQAAAGTWPHRFTRDDLAPAWAARLAAAASTRLAVRRATCPADAVEAAVTTWATELRTQAA